MYAVVSGQYSYTIPNEKKKNTTEIDDHTKYESRILPITKSFDHGEGEHI